MHLSVVRQRLGIVFSLGLTVLVSTLLSSGSLAYSGTLNESTLANNSRLAFAVGLMGLLLAGAFLGLLISLQTPSALFLGSFFYALGLGAFLVTRVDVLNYSWPLTGLISLGVLYVLYSHHDEEFEAGLQPLPDNDPKVFRRSIAD